MGVLVGDELETDLVPWASWPMMWTALDKCRNCSGVLTQILCGGFLPCFGADGPLCSSTIGVGATDYLAWRPGGPTLAIDESGPTISVADIDGREISTLSQNQNQQWIGYSVAVYR